MDKPTCQTIEKANAIHWNSVNRLPPLLPSSPAAVWGKGTVEALLRTNALTHLVDVCAAGFRSPEPREQKSPDKSLAKWTNASSKRHRKKVKKVQIGKQAKYTFWLFWLPTAAASNLVAISCSPQLSRIAIPLPIGTLCWPIEPVHCGHGCSIRHSSLA